MKNLESENRTINNSTTKNIGKNEMKNLTTKIGEVTIYSNDKLYLPMRIDQLRDVNLHDLPVGAEIPVYDSISNNHFTLEGMRINLKKEYATRVVIGCVEWPEYMVAEDEELDNLSSFEFIDNFLSALDTKFAPMNQLAA